MTAPAAEDYWLRDMARGRDRAARALGIALQAVTGVIMRKSRLVRSTFADHAYTWAAFGCISAAFFQISTFAGLLTTGVLFVVYEAKVGD